MIPHIQIDTIRYHGDATTICFVAGSSSYNDEAHILEGTQHSVQPGTYVRLNDIHALIGALLDSLADSPATAEEVLNTLGHNLVMQVGE